MVLSFLKLWGGVCFLFVVGSFFGGVGFVAFFRW